MPSTVNKNSETKTGPAHRTNISTLERLPLLNNLADDILQRLDSFRLYHEIFFGFTTDDRVYYLSAGKKQPRVINDLTGKKIIDIVCFKNIYLALSKNGEVYWLQNFEPIKFIDNGVISIKSGPDHFLALKQNKDVLAFGNTSTGRLGLGKVDAPIERPTVIPALTGKKIIEIECGLKHSMALNKDGRVFAWGNNHFLQLGLPNLSNARHKPEMLPICEPIKAIRCSAMHSLFWTLKGDLYITGKGYSSLQKIYIADDFILNSLLVIPYFYHDNKDNKVLVACGGQGKVELFTVGDKFDETHPDKKRVYSRSMADFVLEVAKYKTFPAVVKVTREGTGPKGKAKFSPGKPPVQIKLASFVESPVTEVPTLLSSSLSSTASISLASLMEEANRSSAGKIMAKIAEAFDKPDTADVIFVFPNEDESIYAHRSILSIASGYLMEQFTTEWNGLTKIEITDQPYATFYQFLKYLYTDQIDHIDDSCVLLRLILIAKEADNFDVRLQSLCGSQLESRLDLVTCCNMFEIARELGLVQLEARVLTFIVDHFYEVITSDSYFQLKPENQKLINLRYTTTVPQKTN